MDEEYCEKERNLMEKIHKLLEWKSKASQQAYFYEEIFLILPIIIHTPNFNTNLVENSSRTSEKFLPA